MDCITTTHQATIIYMKFLDNQKTCLISYHKQCAMLCLLARIPLFEKARHNRTETEL